MCEATRRHEGSILHNIRPDENVKPKVYEFTNKKALKKQKQNTIHLSSLPLLAQASALRNGNRALAFPFIQFVRRSRVYTHVAEA